jgi:16S rRNA (guanine(1405)-N(7))-methyltransferase
MAHHTSTRERLPILDAFYSTLFTGLPPIKSVLDLACGLNALALPWMPLAGDVRYFAYDIYRDQVDFLNRCFPLLSCDGRAQVCDLLQCCPDKPADIALLLKTIPCLEQVDKDVGRRLLDGVNAPVVIVSFPVHSLGGHGKGMLDHYERHFYELVAGHPWQIERFVFATELVYRLRR